MNRYALTGLALLYIAQNIPVYFFTVGVLSILRKEGIGLEWVALIPLLALPWAFKFLWAPLVDRLKARIRWTIGLQLLTAALLFSLSYFQIATNLGSLFLIGITMSLVGSTQDIAIDAFAIEQARADQRGLVNTLQASGAALGSVIGGTLLLFLYERVGWDLATKVLAVLVAASIIPFALMQNYKKLQDGALKVHERFTPSLRRTFARPEILRLLGLCALTRICEGLAMGMQQPLLIDRGVSLEVVGLVVGTIGAGVGLVAAWTSGLLQRFFEKTRVLIGSLVLRTLVYGTLAASLL